MRSSAVDVDAYLAEIPDDRRQVLAAIRELCLQELTGFTETMSFGMPSYERDGVAEVAWAGQKQYLSLYILRSDVVAMHRNRLGDVGKSCIRYRKPEHVDLDVVRSMLAATAAARGPVR